MLIHGRITAEESAPQRLAASPEREPPRYTSDDARDDDPEDSLAASVGIITAVLIGLVLWAIILGLVFWVR